MGSAFRGPLTAIEGYATTLLRHEQHLTPDERPTFLHTISEASTHLGKLVDRFLILAQLEMRSSPFLPASVDLLALVREAVMSAFAPFPSFWSPLVGKTRTGSKGWIWGG
jgi:signal transduction histidine kinase